MPIDLQMKLIWDEAFRVTFKGREVIGSLRTNDRTKLSYIYIIFIVSYIYCCCSFRSARHRSFRPFRSTCGRGRLEALLPFCLEITLGEWHVTLKQVPSYVCVYLCLDLQVYRSFS